MEYHLRLRVVPEGLTAFGAVDHLEPIRRHPVGPTRLMPVLGDAVESALYEPLAFDLGEHRREDQEHLGHSASECVLLIVGGVEVVKLDAVVHQDEDLAVVLAPLSQLDAVVRRPEHAVSLGEDQRVPIFSPFGQPDLEVWPLPR